MTRQIQILVKRDSIEAYKNFDFIPKEFELVTAYDVKTKKIIYKLGDGVTPWKKLKKITKLSQLDKFAVYTKNCPRAMIYLNPFMCNEVIDKLNKKETKNETK